MPGSCSIVLGPYGRAARSIPRPISRARCKFRSSHATNPGCEDDESRHAGVLVTVAAFCSAFQAPGWWPKLGAAVLAATVAWVYARMHRTRRAHAEPPGDLDLGRRLRREIAKVDAQIDLLRRVATWYVAPLAAGGTAWALSMLPAAGLPAGPSWLAAGIVLLVCAGIFAFVGWGVVWLNRRALDGHLYPYRRELEAMLEGLRAS